MIDGLPCLLIDTGGLFGEGVLTDALESQTFQAVEEAQLVLLMLDAREGLTAFDHDIVDALRTRGATVIGVLNKTDGLDAYAAAAEFAELGLGELIMISASHGKGVAQLRERVVEEANALEPAETEMPAVDPDAIPVAIIGRPNVGKSTLINRLLGEERQVVADLPGTTMGRCRSPVRLSFPQAAVLTACTCSKRRSRRPLSLMAN